STVYDTNLAVQLIDKYGNPSGPNWGPVLFLPIAGTSGANASFTGSANINTDVNGLATAPALTANSIAGTLNVLAFYNSFYQTFTLTNVAGAPANLVAVPGSTPQSAAVNA